MYGLKTGGRKKGTPNRRTQDLLEKVRERWPDYHPVLAMIELAHQPDLPLELRLQCHKEVAHYLEAKRKAVEVSGEIAVVELTVGKLPECA